MAKRKKKEELEEEEELLEDIQAAEELHLDDEVQDDANLKRPSQLPVLALTKRCFFPGMAAPILIEPGPFFEVLKSAVKSESKMVALLLTKKEDFDVSNPSKVSDFFNAGVCARIVRILRLEGAGAQVDFEYGITHQGHKGLSTKG